MLGDSCFRPPRNNPEAKRGYLQSSSFKMALAFAIILGFAGSILGYFHYYFNKGHYISGAERLIKTEMNHIVALWPIAGGPKIISNLLSLSDDDIPKIYAVEDKDRNLFLGNIRKMPENLKPMGHDLVTFHINGDSNGKAVQGLYAATYHDFEDGSRLMVALHIGEIHDKHILLQNLSLLTMALMLIVVLVSFAISTFVVSRTNRIANTARDIIETGDLSQRVNIDSTWDDLSYLGSVLNSLLERMENLVFSVRQISDNIAHDMRTPLTRLRTHLEELLDGTEARCNEELQDRAEKLIADADHLLATFNALLRIGRLESTRDTLNFSMVDLNALLEDVVELYDPYAEKKHISLGVIGDTATTVGDHHLLFQAFANVLDNAIKFSPERSLITAEIIKYPKEVIIQISDHGVGVSDDDKKHVFNRFFRGDKSRNSPGTGLGLSLVAAIIRLHKGYIDLKDNDPGLIVEISLPVCDAVKG